MPLNFPVVEDIHLRKAPVREVICQVRFPTILRIAKEEPAEFQERVRSRFPLLEAERRLIIETEGLKPGGRAQFSPAIFRFYSRDKARSVSLGTDFYALSVKDYRHWEDFATCLAHVAESAQDVYAIPYATRIGLRYINVLDRDFGGFDTFDQVLNLLRDELTVMLRTDVILSPDLSVHRIQTATNGDRFTFLYGFTPEETSDAGQFLLDFDHYAEGELDLESLLSRCERYHQNIYSAFRWCIAEDKLDFFEPVPEDTRGEQ